MSAGKVRVGELLALVGAICVIAALVVPYYEAPTGALSAWDTFGPGVALLLAATAAALCLFATTLTERTTALPVAAAVWTVPLGLAGSISAIVRLLARPQHASAVCSGAWLALVGTLAILAGAWLSIRDERRPRYHPATPKLRPRPNGGASEQQSSAGGQQPDGAP